MIAIDNGLFKYDLTDYHAVLGLSVKAEAKDIRKRYLKIAQTLHPDTCKAASDQEKQMASQLLSKLVNPAYENLSKDQNRKEHQIILTQIGKRLASDANKITLGSESAKKLFQAQGNIDAIYQNLINEIAQQQYNSIKGALVQIAQLSELNLVYLMLTQGQNIGSTVSQNQTQVTVNSNGKTAPESTPQAPSVTEKPKNPYLRRAQEYIEKNNYAKAVLELREGLKSNPNEPEIHSLLGLAYIKENQLAMGRVHVKKALQIDPKNKIALKCQDLLDQMNPETKTTKETPKKSGGLFGLFGGKK
jgi:curved DNA-binding protein CbpA